MATEMRSRFVILFFLVAVALGLIVGQSSCQQQQAATSRIRANPLAPRLLKNNINQEPTTNQHQQQQQSTTAKRSTTTNSSATTNNQNPSGRFEFVEDELPSDFYEMPPEQLDLGMNATGRAPVPILNVAVLQNGQLIDSEVNVHPGTPLEMVIFLDDKSAKVYGLLASYLKAQDDTNRRREEVIILNGCSIDTYIFGNFELNQEDQSLRAKFRAFKFPDSNFVRFIGTVNVCIKQCPKVVDCVGSRRKRRATDANQDKQKLVQLTVSTVLRISNSPKQ